MRSPVAARSRVPGAAEPRSGLDQVTGASLSGDPLGLRIAFRIVNHDTSGSVHSISANDARQRASA